ncbi:MAG: transglutaminase family protein [Chloroflexota bacterium]|nr:transglutaminase family protein [Chloroflexota bacterium]
MKVEVVHTTNLTYDADVVEGVMDVRLGPLSDADQRWEHYDLRVSPSAAVRRYRDGFNNWAHLITLARPHRYVEIVSCGRISTLLADPFRLPDRAPEPLTPSELADYLTPSALVPASPALAALAERHRPARPKDAFEAVRALTAFVYADFEYQKDVTSVSTTVDEVLAHRTGVCQDFAHVLLGLCRAVGIPARYVSGYIVAARLAQAQTLGTMSQSQELSTGPSRGAGASHAWIEAFTPSHGWRGFDPTNNLLASEQHVKMAIGRDYADVPPTRGTFRGVAEEHLSVEVVARAVA